MSVSVPCQPPRGPPSGLAMSPPRACWEHGSPVGSQDGSKGRQIWEVDTSWGLAGISLLECVHGLRGPALPPPPPPPRTCLFLSHRPLPQQGPSLRRDPALAPGHHLQHEQPLLSAPDGGGGPRRGGQLRRLHVSDGGPGAVGLDRAVGPGSHHPPCAPTASPACWPKPGGSWSAPTGTGSCVASPNSCPPCAGSGGAGLSRGVSAGDGGCRGTETPLADPCPPSPAGEGLPERG